MNHRHAIAMISCPPPATIDEHQSPASWHLVTRTVTAGCPTRATHPWVLIEPLSRSEMRVPRYLPANLSAPEIARELSVSVTTVRTPIRHLFVKLGAHRI
jgi:DNA-binding CsgD family transcriptional regulator